MAQLGVGRVPTSRRAQLLDRCRHMVAVDGGNTPVGFAAFEIVHHDLLVHEIATRPHADDALSALVVALELACLAAGAQRLFIARRNDAGSRLAAYGYREALSGSWLEKSVL